MKTPTSRIEVSGQGLGEVSDAMIEKRAHELAVSDGRHIPHEGDFTQARLELKGLHPEEPEVDVLTSHLTAWDEPPSSSGHRAPTIDLDDEANMAEKLVEEGSDEAEHERRVRAYRP